MVFFEDLKKFICLQVCFRYNLSAAFAVIENLYTGRYSSGQRGETVNLLAYAFLGSNPSLPTIELSLTLRNEDIVFCMRKVSSNRWSHGA